MLDLTEEQWDVLLDKADETIQQAIKDLPDPVQKKANEWTCWLARYTPRTDAIILGLCVLSCNAICIYVGQIHEHCHQNIDETMQSVRQVYYHELAHAIGNLSEPEVKERGL